MTNSMKRISRLLVLLFIFSTILAASPSVWAQPAEPVVAIHVSELTQALETMPAKPPTPNFQGTTGYEWWVSEWHYFVMYESLKEALRSDGTPYVEVTDADIAGGRLLFSDGSPRYPILISLASEAVGNNELAPLRDYVGAGGMLFIGSSAFTRNPDGTARGDFAFASEMGLHAQNSLQNWYANRHFSKVTEHRLAANLPQGPVSWRMPLRADEISMGVAPNHAVHDGQHYVFQVSAAAGTTVVANGENGPLLATRQYGKGNFVYHGAMQPLIGHGAYDPSLYAYLIYRNAIEWAFEAANLPIIRLSPWRFEYDAAYVVRHDFENNKATIRLLESSASYEYSAGAKPDYFFCTGTLREEMPDRDTVIASLRRAVTNYNATIGSHNGGLKNPVISLPISDFDYWHWGPDEVLDISPPGYSSGKEYARASISASFQDIEGWLAGTDNGRAGCGSTGTCPRLWAAPYFNSTREDSYELLDEEGISASSKGEQKIGPFPHLTLSYKTPGKRFKHVTLPASDWFVGAEIPGAIEWGHTVNTMRAAVDFYYNLGSVINLYGHEVSNDTTLLGAYVKYCASKPRMWAGNAVSITDWWNVRSNAMVIPAYSITGDTVVAEARIMGSTDQGTAIDVAIPAESTNIQIFLNNAPASPADYRIVGSKVKIRVGTSTTSAKVQYTVNATSNPVPTITSLSPAIGSAGGAAFTLTVNGSGYVVGSVVRWNGANRATTFVSGTELSAAIEASDIAAAGTAQVSVFNAAPGGGTSNEIGFTVTSSQTGAWTQTDWAGGSGQSVWADGTRYDSATGIDDRVTGQIGLASGSSVLFSDDFTNTPSPWVTALGTWIVTGGVMQGTGAANQYSYAYISSTQWSDYTVQGRIQLPAGSFGGGIGGRVDAATGAHYGVWVYPAGSPGGSNVLKLWKFRGWENINGGPYTGVPMQQVSLPDVGTGWHTLQVVFLGNRIMVYYDAVLMIDATDNNYDSRAPYLSGGISADWWTWSLPYTITIDDVSVTSLSDYNNSGVLASSAFDGGEGVQWQTVSWDAAAGGSSTDICVRTRAADLADQLAAASWSNCYSAGGSGFLSGNRRWVQYQIELSSADASASPVLNEIRIGYVSGPSTNPAPLINTLEPESAAAGGAGFTLTVSGSGFVSSSVVRWNGADCATTFVSSAELRASLSSSDIASPGTAQVDVFTPAPGGGSSNAATFTIAAAANPAPVTSSLSPASAGVGGSAFTLRVYGSGFTSNSVVRWNGADRVTTFVSAGQVTASIAASDIVSEGSVQVSVFNPAPGGGSSNAQSFVISSGIVLTSLSPSYRTAGRSSFTLSVYGGGFVSGSVVRWNGANRTTTFVSSTRLTASIPSSDIALPGTAQVTVYDSSTVRTSNALTFTVTNPVPQISSLSPSSRTAGGSSFTLTLYGSGFVPGSLVRWNGESRTTTYVSSTRLTAAIPASDIALAGYVQVTVFNPAPGGGLSSARTFRIDSY